MRKFKIIPLIVVILILAVTLPGFVKFVVSIPYYPNIETAVRNKSSSKSIIKMATIMGKEGVVYIGLGDYNSIFTYNFHTKTKTENGSVLYKIAKEVGPKYLENCMAKINTAPGSTEQIMIGVGEALANECAEKTGINPEFIHFENDGEQYTIWYIISADGLNELPDYQLNNLIIEKIPPTRDYRVLGYIIEITIIVVIIIWRGRKRVKTNSDT